MRLEKRSPSRSPAWSSGFSLSQVTVQLEQRSPSRGQPLKHPQKPCVRGGEFVLIQFLRADPAPFRAAQRLRFILLPLASEEPQMHPLFRVILGQTFHQLADCDLDAQFLPKLANQAGFKTLVRLAFAARKFPEPAEVGVVVTFGDEELFPTKDNPGGNLDNRAV